MIQSGRNVSLDNQTRLTIYAYSPLQGGAKVRFTTPKKALLKAVGVLFESQMMVTKIRATVLTMLHG